MPVFYKEAFGKVDIRLTEYKFDNTGRDEFESDTSVHSLRQYANKGWTEIELKGVVELPAETQELFPPDERSDPPGKVVVAIDCLDTHYRYGKEITTEKIDEGEYTFEETLPRRYAYGDVHFRPLLVRTKECDEPGFAQYPYMRLADGKSVVVSFDDVETAGSSLMDVRFESFEKNTGLPDHNLYHLERTDATNPCVWINEDYELVARVLDHDANSGWGANLQGPLAQWIAKDVVTELVLWSILCAGEGEYDAEWQKDLLEEYGPEIYPDTDADDPEGLYEQLSEGGDEAHYIVNSVEKVVQDSIRITKPLEEFIDKNATDHFLKHG